MYLVNNTNLVHNLFLVDSYLSILINMNILRESCAPSWFHLQGYKEMHGQQNIKITMHLEQVDGK